MQRLFKIEWIKLWNNKSSKVLIIAYFILLSLITLLAIIDFNFIGIDFRLADMGIFNFPYIWHFNTYIAAILKVFLAIVIVSMISNEYSYGTLKQNLIDGLSKKEFIFSKFSIIVVLSLVSTVFVFLISLILGLIFSSYNEASIILTDLDYLFAYSLKLIGFFSFCMFMALLIKRSAFALGFLVLWNILEFFFVKILEKILPNFPELIKFINRIMPLESMSLLILNPSRRTSYAKNIETQMGLPENLIIYNVDYFQILIVFVWIVIFLLISYNILKNRDL
jgi:ABC-type transport system involved in multi-copper enzyme maturation permease subunit